MVQRGNCSRTKYTHTHRAKCNESQLKHYAIKKPVRLVSLTLILCGMTLYSAQTILRKLSEILGAKIPDEAEM